MGNWKLEIGKRVDPRLHANHCACALPPGPPPNFLSATYQSPKVYSIRIHIGTYHSSYHTPSRPTVAVIVIVIVPDDAATQIDNNVRNTDRIRLRQRLETNSWQCILHSIGDFDFLSLFQTNNPSGLLQSQPAIVSKVQINLNCRDMYQLSRSNVPSDDSSSLPSTRN